MSVQAKSNNIEKKILSSSEECHSLLFWSQGSAQEATIKANEAGRGYYDVKNFPTNAKVKAIIMWSGSINCVIWQTGTAEPVEDDPTTLRCWYIYKNFTNKDISVPVQGKILYTLE